MNKTAIGLLTVIVWIACATSHALWSVNEKGTWPTSWPKQLEPLRNQARSATGGLVNQTFYEIPFTDRDQFEAAWPHLLSLKTNGSPLVLRPSGHDLLSSPMKAGVRVFEALPSSKNNKYAGKPIPGVTHLGERWLYTTYIELIVDGEIVDLNRIALPNEETPIVDQRFTEPASRGSGYSRR
jgi:hypothetical protein